MANRRIALVGARLGRDRAWTASLICAISGVTDCCALPETSPISCGSVEIQHCADTAQLEGTEKLVDLSRTDLVLFGLGSYAEASIEFSILESSFSRLYHEAVSSLVRRPLPFVVAFALDREGEEALKRLSRRADPWIRWIPGSGLDRTFFQRFRREILEGLKDAVVLSLDMSYLYGRDLLDRWLRQFVVDDIPVALRILKEFRYYSNECQRRLLDSFLATIKLRSRLDKGPLWMSYLGRPNKSGPALLALATKTEWVKKAVTDRGGGGVKRGHASVKSYDDLVEDFVPALLTMDAGEVLNICFVDDVIGSGGQCISYLGGFLRHLRYSAERFAGKRHVTEVWSRVLRALKGCSGVPSVRIECVFTIGISGRELERRFGGGLRNAGAERGTMVGVRPKTGLLEVSLEEFGRIGEYVSVPVHIADYTKNVGELCDDGCLDRTQVSTLLTRSDYSMITRPREKEHPLQFEPLGWKDGGGLIATYMNCPGNTLPIIWGDGGPSGGRRWTPLFRRFFNPWHDGSSSVQDIMLSLSGSGVSLRSRKRREMLTFVLRCRSRDSDAVIGETARFPADEISSICNAVSRRIQADSGYRRDVRTLFQASS